MSINAKMDIVSELAKFFNENCTEKLEEVKKEIVDQIKDLLDEQGEDYRIIAQNSVHRIKYFSISHRVKEDISLFEKFIRKSLGLQIINTFNLQAISDIDINRDKIRMFLLGYDDVIGVRVVTELKEDCKQVYELIKNNKSRLAGIEFKDIDEQPVYMQNGLPIYNIKATYIKDFGFELQIKSKIDSAWGDIDHGIFYKNYLYNPIKDTVQITMNHVGNLLGEVEKLLFSLREANNNYRDNAERIIFLEKVYQTFSEKVKDIVRVPYKFDKIIDFLLHLFRKVHGSDISIVDAEIVSFEIGFDYLDYQYSNQSKELKNYFDIRNASFDIIILENIYLQWIVSHSKKTVTRENYIEIVKDLVNEDVINYLSTQVGDEDKLLMEIFPLLLDYIKTDKLFFAIDLYKSILRYYKALLDVEASDEYDRQMYLRCIIVIYGVKLFGGSIDLCIRDMMDQLEDDLEFLEDIYNKMKTNIKLMGEVENPEFPLYREFVSQNDKIFRRTAELLEGQS